MSPRHLVLVGMMGSGKTTVGEALARRLDRPFVDVDAEIESRLGHTIGEIFGLEGEPAFRRHESEVLADVLATAEPSVICTGGGAVLDAGNRELMRANGTVIWLQATPAVLARRLAVGEGRPLLRFDGDDDGEGTQLVRRIERLCAERQPAYETAANEVLSVDDLTVDDAVTAVCKMVSREAR